MLRLFTVLARLLRAGLALTILAGFTTAVPWLLTTAAGWPLTWLGWTHPNTPPSLADLATAVTSPWSDQAILALLATGGWILWAQFIRDLIIELLLAAADAADLRAGRPHPATGGHGPLRWAAAALVGAILSIVLLDTARAALGTPGTARAAAADAAAHRPAVATAPARPTSTGGAHLTAAHHLDGTATTCTPTPETAHHRRHPIPAWAKNAPGGVHHVIKGDTLWDIAETTLGNPYRWREIYVLNRGHVQANGYALNDPDLIHIGWTLALPARKPAPAVPPAAQPPAADPATPPAPPPQPKPDDGTTEPPKPTPSANGPASPDPDGVVVPPTAPSATAPTPANGGSDPAHTPAPAEPNPSRTAAPSTPTSSTDASAPPEEQTTPEPSNDQDGVRLPSGSFVPWTLAAAIAAAAAMVWLQRRRRFVPGEQTHDDPPDLPAPVTELHRQVTRNPNRPAPNDLAERAAAVPALPLLPPGGVGLVGDGAHAAARAALIATLASGGPREPDQRGEVVIDGTTLSTLIGADAATLGPWPRLHIADDFDHALAILDARLLHRARILDEHSLTDLDSLRHQSPDEEALPPVLLIGEAPPPGARMRAHVSFGLGNGLDVSALLLGEWPHGSTITVADDGHTRVIAGPAVDAIGERAAVLETQEAVAILTTLREAHTGEPPNPALHPPAVPQPPASAQTVGRPADPKPAEPDPGEPHSDDNPPLPQPPDGSTPLVEAAGSRTKVRLRVLGTPGVEEVTLPGRPLRGKAAELAVYLACHPDGADTETIAEYLIPEVRRRQARQQVHTNASNLRHVLGRAGGPQPGGYVLKRGTTARYRLDPTHVAVDLWQLRDLLNRAQLASAPARTDLLRQACDIYTAPLAAGCDYEWIEPHREKARRWGTEAHLMLADDLLDPDPRAASDLLDKAIGLDHYNEELYRKAMHARHHLGDADGIRALLRALTKAMADLDAEPDETTTELATTLRMSLEQR